MTFLDSNVIVYAVDPRDGRKNRIAAELVEAAIGGGDFRISAQVLFEFANVCLKKLKLAPNEVLLFLEALKFIPVVNQTPVLVIRAVEIKTLYGISLQDSMIVATAESAGCDELLTENIGDGQSYGGVRVRNPFKLV